jgi:hypothetical protein
MSKRRDRRRRNREREPWQEATRVCAWCGKSIPEGPELFTVPAKARPGLEVEIAMLDRLRGDSG